MSYGYYGRILRVDLGTGEVGEEHLSDAIYRRYFGGSGMALYFLLRDQNGGVDPFGPDNRLVFMVSPLVGIPFPGVVRFTVAARSPLTGYYGESEAGGFWGPELKKAGWDGIVVTGRAERPVYLSIVDGEAEIRDARHLWGKDPDETQEAIRVELGCPSARVALIGRGGEQLIRYASVSNELRHFAGRTGMGAVMGSKNLKAVAVVGTGEVPVADRGWIKELAKDFGGNYRTHPRGRLLHELGSANSVIPLNAMGMLPTRNFTTGVFAGAEAISAQAIRDSILAKSEGCYGCPVRCKKAVKVEGRYHVDPKWGGPEYETIAAFGSNCEVSDLEAIAYANQLCNTYVVDTISTGNAVAFAMECFERGILTLKDTGGLVLRFGNADAMVALVEQICKREGLGRLLGEGVRRASEAIGRGAEEYAIHVKGQEFAYHEPRGKNGVGLGFAVSPTGADHIETPHDGDVAQRGPSLDDLAALGMLEPIPPRYLGPEKVRWFCLGQRLWAFYNCAGVCNYVAAPINALTPNKLVDLIRAVTGWNFSLWELMKVGERSVTMARLFNLREGLTPDEDTLPKRFFLGLESGPLAGVGLNEKAFREAVRTYYALLNWEPERGVPTWASVVDLDIQADLGGAIEGLVWTGAKRA